MTNTTETSNRPTHRVYAVKKISEDKSHWDEIGGVCHDWEALNRLHRKGMIGDPVGVALRPPRTISKSRCSGERRGDLGVGIPDGG